MSEKEVWGFLESVNDAHVPVSLRKMGMIQDVAISGNNDVTIRMAIPCLACPAMSLMQDQIREAIGCLDDVGNVIIDNSGTGTWSRAHVDASAKPFMRQFGLQI